MTEGFEELCAEITKLVVELAPQKPVPGTIAAQANFVDDLGYHSIVLVELGFAIEEQYDLEPITAEDVEDVSNARELAEFVVRRLTARH